ncbi:DUF6708 domain-containing protein [Winslowiella toletana]|uniref:DUF6708 domain-containing protein n=2 Tax=Winslowiella TaxID=2997349 RepID=UPI0028BE260D|nr:DUF6708 domain-containing protein [Winslowiella toletana]WNN43189.1 hypothetical protein RIN69_15970 [Winslowiella toletana]
MSVESGAGSREQETNMDYYGLFPKFKFNRPLKPDEKKNQLKQNEKIDLDGQSVMPDVKVIAMNSHCLELVDKYYSAKGFMSLLAAPVVIMLTATFLATSYSFFFVYGWGRLSGVVLNFLSLLVIISMDIFMFKVLKAEWFAWTHYPIRFDRINRQVHFFRLDGTIRSVPWEKVFFTSGLSHRKDFNKDYYISGHILADDNETVIDTFCLPSTDSDRKQLERHWEFVRRYMEEGPASVAPAVNFCLPIAGKREGYQFGLLYSLYLFNGAPMFLFPLLFALSFILSIPRYIAMVTSKVPVWPENIEAQCAAAVDDPYAIDASSNPKHPLRDLFRKTPEEK